MTLAIRSIVALSSTMLLGACVGPNVRTPSSDARLFEKTTTGAPAVDAPGVSPSPRWKEPPAWAPLESAPGNDALQAGARAVIAGDWKHARSLFEEALAGSSASVTLDARLAEEALLGRACTMLKDDACAARAYGAVVTTWDAANASGDAASLDDEARQRALLAVAEALAAASDQARSRAERIVMPPLSFGADEDVRNVIDERVKPWIEARRTLVDEADADDARIEKLEPSAPPRFAVDALGRIALGRARFVAAVRAARLPNELVENAKLRADYYATLDRIAVEDARRGRASLERCAIASDETGIADDITTRCKRALGKD